MTPDKQLGLERAKAFARALYDIRSGDYASAENRVKHNHPSDQRIIAKRIELAKNTNANRSNQ